MLGVSYYNVQPAVAIACNALSVLLNTPAVMLIADILLLRVPFVPFPLPFIVPLKLILFS